MTFLAYAITVGAAAFGLTSAPAGVVGGLLGRSVGLPLAALFGAALSWGGVHLLWSLGGAGGLPVAALALSGGAIALHGNAAHQDLNVGARTLMAAEMYAILIVGGLLLLVGDPIRWF